MRVLQYAKRSVLTVAVVCAVLTGCGDSGPDVPFNPAGTTEDLAAMNSSFGSAAFTSFSTFSLMFDAALGGAPMISASAAAIDARAHSRAGMQAAAARSAKRLARALVPSTRNGSFSATAAAIPAEAAGKTFIYDVGTGTYVPSDRELLASNTVRFILYAVDPVTLAPVDPLVETGYVDLVELASGATNSARVTVVSGTTTYLNYTVSTTSTTSSGRVTVIGFVTDGINQADISLRATLTFNAGLTLTYSVHVPTRDVSIDLTLTSSGLDPETGTIDVRLDMRGPNGVIAMTGQFTASGSTLTVRINGDVFATITTSGAGEPVITGIEGQPLTDADIMALGAIFLLTEEAFASFDRLFAPVGVFIEPAA